MFLLWLAPAHGPVAARLVVAVVLGLADILAPTSQDVSAGFPGQRFNLDTPQSRPAFLSPDLSRSGAVRLASVVSFMSKHSLEDRL
jgi:hypothetical protein